MRYGSSLVSRLACIAHKSLKICERCRLWQRNSPATPETTSALRATACPESERSRHSEATAEFHCFLERRV